MSFAPSRGKCQSPLDEFRVPIFRRNPDHQIGPDAVEKKHVHLVRNGVFRPRPVDYLVARVVRSARVRCAIAHRSRYARRRNPRFLIVPIVASVSRIEDTSIFGTCYDSDRRAVSVTLRYFSTLATDRPIALSTSIPARSVAIVSLFFFIAKLSRFDVQF